MPTQPSVLLVDGYSLIHRGFHALPLLSYNGVYTNAVQGFFSMLFKAVAEVRPDGLCVMLDMHAPTFRHTMYDQYKAGRKPTPEELRPQFAVVREILSAMGVRQLELEGYEADDLLGSAARIFGESGVRSFILTGDRDSLQLVGGSTQVILTRTGITDSLLLTPEKVKEVYGFTPEMVPDMKGLMGDSSDNIPGVPGVGEKTALKLLGEYGTLDAVLEHADEVKGKLGEKLRAGRELALLSRDLGTIRRSAPIDVTLESCPISGMPAGKAALEKYGLKRLGQQLDTLYDAPQKPTERQMMQRAAAAPVPPQEDAPAPVDFPARQSLPPLQTAEAVGAFLQTLQENEPLALCMGEDVSLCRPSGETVLLPIKRDMLGAGMYEDEALHALLPVLTSHRLIVHGRKSLLHRLCALGLPLPAPGGDTMIGAYLLRPGQKSFTLAATLCAEGLRVEDEPAPPDAWDVYRLFAAQQGRLAAQGLAELLSDIELPLTDTLFHMERVGFCVDGQVLVALGKVFQQELEASRDAVYRLTGVEGFNLNSPRQLGEVLFEKLGLPAGKKSKQGAYSTDAEVLEKLLPLHPAIEPLLSYRKLSKLMGTYIDGLQKLIDPSGRVHTTFDQTAAVTGRISSLEPNLQNIPVRTPEGREIRKAFVAREGCVLLDADYSQIELRVLAHLSGDPAMIDAFRKGQDIHARTAAEIAGVPIGEVTPDMRSHAKATNFGVVYGISGFGLSRNAGISRKDAQAFIDRYFERYPKVKAFMDECVRLGYERGYSETMLHRRRPLPELQSPNRNIRAFGERAAMNTPVQGTAADLIKLAMVRVEKRLMEGGYEARLILQVHDELVVECPVAEQQAVAALLKETMEGVSALSVPLLAEVGVGKSWYESK